MIYAIYLNNSTKSSFNCRRGRMFCKFIKFQEIDDAGSITNLFMPHIFGQAIKNISCSTSKLYLPANVYASF